MKSISTLSLLLGIAIGTMAPARAGVIPIVNSSFESPTGAYYTTTNGSNGGVAAPTIPGWTMTTTHGNIGVFTPTAISYTPPDGKQVGYIGGGAPFILDPGSFSQILGVGPVGGTVYDLGMYVGARGEGYTLGDYSIELLAGSTVLASVTDPVAPAPGTFEHTALIYHATAADASLGKLEIVLTGGSSAGGTAYGQVGFDDVTLTTTGVPEPSTWALILLGFAGLGFASYRRARGKRRAGLAMAWR